MNTTTKMNKRVLLGLFFALVTPTLLFAANAVYYYDPLQMQETLLFPLAEIELEMLDPIDLEIPTIEELLAADETYDENSEVVDMEIDEDDTDEIPIIWVSSTTGQNSTQSFQ